MRTSPATHRRLVGLLSSCVAAVATMTLAAPATPVMAATGCLPEHTAQVPVSLRADGRTVKATTCIQPVFVGQGGNWTVGGHTADTSASDPYCTVAFFRLTSRGATPDRANQTRVVRKETSLNPGCNGTHQFFTAVYEVPSGFRFTTAEVRTCIHHLDRKSALQCSAWRTIHRKPAS